MDSDLSEEESAPAKKSPRKLSGGGKLKSRPFDPPMTSSTIEFRSDPGAEPYRISPAPPLGSDDLCDDDDVGEDDWYMTCSIAKLSRRRRRRERERERERCKRDAKDVLRKKKIRCFFMG